MYLLPVLAKTHCDPFIAPQSDKMAATAVVHVLISTPIAVHARSSHLPILSGFLLGSVYIPLAIPQRKLTL
jgi:hypothetical protein